MEFQRKVEDDCPQNFQKNIVLFLGRVAFKKFEKFLDECLDKYSGRWPGKSSKALFGNSLDDSLKNFCEFCL